MAPTVIGATIILVHDVHTDEDWFYAAGGEHNVPNGVINNNIAMERYFLLYVRLIIIYHLYLVARFKRVHNNKEKCVAIAYLSVKKKLLK